MAFGWQALWLINGAIALGYAARDRRAAVRRSAGRARAQRRRCCRTSAPCSARPVRCCWRCAFGIYTFQYLALSGLLPTLLVDRMGLSIAAAGTISAIAVAANAVGNMSAGALLRLGVPVWSILAGAFAFVGARRRRHLLRRGAGRAGGDAGGGEPRTDRPHPGLDLCGGAEARADLGAARDRARPDQPGDQSRQPRRPGRHGADGGVARLGRRAVAVCRRRGDRRDRRAAAAPRAAPAPITPAEYRLP